MTDNSPATELLPTMKLRWFVDFDGERILEQGFQHPSGHIQFCRVPEVDYFDGPHMSPRENKNERK